MDQLSELEIQIINCKEQLPSLEGDELENMFAILQQLESDKAMIEGTTTKSSADQSLPSKLDSNMIRSQMSLTKSSDQGNRDNTNNSNSNQQKKSTNQPQQSNSSQSMLFSPGKFNQSIIPHVNDNNLSSNQSMIDENYEILKQSYDDLAKSMVEDMEEIYRVDEGDLDTKAQLVQSITKKQQKLDELEIQLESQLGKFNLQSNIPSQINKKRKYCESQNSQDAWDDEEQPQQKIQNSDYSIQSQMQQYSTITNGCSNEQKPNYQSPFYQNQQSSSNMNNMDNQKMSIEESLSIPQYQSSSNRQESQIINSQRSGKVILYRSERQQPIVINMTHNELRRTAFSVCSSKNENIEFLRYEMDRNSDIKKQIFMIQNDSLLQRKYLLIYQCLFTSLRNVEQYGLTENERKYLSEYAKIIQQYISIRGMRITGINKDFKSEGIQKNYKLIAENDTEILIIDWFIKSTGIFYKFLIDYEENFLDYIRVIKQINPNKIVRLCLLPLKIIEEVKFIEYMYEDIQKLQQNQGTNAIFQKTMITNFNNDLKYRSEEVKRQYYKNGDAKAQTIEQFANDIVANKDIESIEFYSILDNSVVYLFKRDMGKSYEQMIDKQQFPQFYYIHLLLCHKLNFNSSINLPEEIIERLSKTMQNTHQKYDFKTYHQSQKAEGTNSNNMSQNMSSQEQMQDLIMNLGLGEFLNGNYDNNQQRFMQQNNNLQPDNDFNNNSNQNQNRFQNYNNQYRNQNNPYPYRYQFNNNPQYRNYQSYQSQRSNYHSQPYKKFNQDY